MSQASKQKRKRAFKAKVKQLFIFPEDDSTKGAAAGDQEDDCVGGGGGNPRHHRPAPLPQHRVCRPTFSILSISPFNIFKGPEEVRHTASLICG